MGKLLTEKELVEWLKVCRSTARRWANEAGARRMVGDSVRYDMEVIQAAIDDSSGKKAKRGRKR